MTPGKFQYKPCPACEGQGFLIAIDPNYVAGEVDNGLTLLFSINPNRGRQVQCHRCEGSGRVPDKRG